MTKQDLLAAFGKIHPPHRALTVKRPKGKTHWVFLMTVPKPSFVSIPLVHLELGHGSAERLAAFFAAALDFARERYADPPTTSHASPYAPPDFALSMETRGIMIQGEAFVQEGTPNIAAAWAKLSETLETLGIRVTRLNKEDT